MWELFAPDASLHSLARSQPFAGRDAIGKCLGLANTYVEDVRVVGELSGWLEQNDDDSVETHGLLLRVTMEDAPVDLVDVITLDRHGLVTSATVFASTRSFRAFENAFAAAS
ncbi:hypothetical protein GCM10012275_22580 [Longimycelium tulufanense]|uniref:SnoaL-like domain-containing protein n=1 Tax=Longimycelium tulufanense TaxID=907463 RepID=A0A8J3FUK5_9PSEU|nr:hypothetical protein [Longimycelium tulufanense]GGM51129.1 hypothetical protein GCM10012275_22580 [Longimycelium tulufanense]